MQKNEMKSIIEAVLFTMGEAVEPKVLAQALECGEDEVRAVLDEMVQEKQAEDSGVEIIEIDGSFQMCTKKSAYEYLIKIVSIPKNYRLTDVQLETLSIIAYKQPVTKAEIEKIRGVSSDHAVNRLLEAGLIEECGRMNTPGRPMLFATTQEFLRRFGLKNTEALPDVNTEKVETFKMEAEEEIGYKLDGSEDQPAESVIISGSDADMDEDQAEAGIIADPEETTSNAQPVNENGEQE